MAALSSEIFHVVKVWILLSLQTSGVSPQQPDPGLFPVVYNLASNAHITANATCGDKGPEVFCKLVEHVEPKYKDDNSQCGTCDMQSTDDAKRHPITNAIDGSRNWWQSPPLTRGSAYQRITITLDLKQVYQVAYLVIKAANSPRPGNWILEKSLDGINYQIWQYFAASDNDCWNFYNVAPTIGIPRFKADDEVICTSKYSKLDPLEHGEIFVSLVNGRPGVAGPSSALVDFTSARYIRFRLQKIRTLNADLMTFFTSDPSHIDALVTRRYFYSIKDISIGGQCICYGHARYCPVDPITGTQKCACEQNTCGPNCEKCCPKYNQKPWKPGTYDEGASCEECNCFGHSDTCYYNQTVADNQLSLNLKGEYEGGGVCLNCRDNTKGINCETCADGFYRPAGRSPSHPHPCVECDCSPQGSTGRCVNEDTIIDEVTLTSGLCVPDLKPGTCICKEGYCGTHCNECAPGYTGYPNCIPCPCSRAGSKNIDTCEAECICKDNVAGQFCNSCSEGFYNLQVTNPEGCTRCFCFGVTNQCRSSTWGKSQVMSIDGWKIVDAPTTGDIIPNKTGQGLEFSMSEAAGLGRVLYWQAPEPFLGNKIKSYGGELEYVVRYQVDQNGTDKDFYVANPDVILEGNGLRLAYMGEYYKENVDNLVKVSMTNGRWRHIQGSTSPPETTVPRDEFIVLLSSLDRMLLRASYHIAQTDAVLVRASLDVADSSVSTPDVPIMPQVEICQCPPGFAGTSCETCAPGYRRVENVLIGGKCVPCECNGHADVCNPYTGTCLNCAHNTMGDNCELCAPGYYGNATQGTPEDCRRCDCPLSIAANNFATECVYQPDISDAICLDCQEGYEGRHCERCAEGYFGNPIMPGSFCLECDCNGNLNTSIPGSCDKNNGTCLNCHYNTEGKHCERCKDGFYGTALNGDCTACECNMYGSTSKSCNKTNGQCGCLEHYEGRDCGMCEEGHGNIYEGCPACQCDPVGSENFTCDRIEGHCKCKPGVAGSHCDRCQISHYNFTEAGCSECGCSLTGSVNSSCDVMTGQCSCLKYVTGRTCDRCQENHWGFHWGNGCTSCNCNVTGSVSLACAVDNGICQCKPGVTGTHCNKCEIGYYGFSEMGCKKCPQCPLPGQVCDPIDGKCVCPPNTEGAKCERCAPNTWGYDPKLGCQECACNPLGSIGRQCKVTNGQCLCQFGFAGRQCDQCTHAYYGFPNCQPCACNSYGTHNRTCRPSGCECAEKTGQCDCKDNVQGRMCGQCKEGTFSLTKDHPDGCFSCFCYGKSMNCRQASVHWVEDDLSAMTQTVQINSSSPRVVGRNQWGVLVVPPGVNQISVNTTDPAEPLYMSVPKELLGDMTMSYWNKLEYMWSSTEMNGGDHLSTNKTYATIHLLGNFRIHLVYLKTFNYKPTQDVWFKEHYWQDVSTGQVPSRELFMIALQNVQHMWVRTTHQVNVYNTSVALQKLYRAVPYTAGNMVAKGIEECQCPTEYTGLSCQDPAIGYYRERPKDFIDSSDILDLVGISVPCQCNNHAVDCVKESGVCIDCQHNTEGIHCEKCRKGFYGNATIGTPNDCQQCACPLTVVTNNFSPLCTADGDDYICTACETGYTGRHCEECEDGFYGSPTTEGSTCKPCECNPTGSYNNTCDKLTGQCPCIKGITGRVCDQCQPDYALDNGRCISCVEGCTGIILTDVEEMRRQVDGMNITIEMMLPWDRLMKLENNTEIWQSALKAARLRELGEVDEQIKELQVEATSVEVRVSETSARHKVISPDVETVFNDAHQVAADIQQLWTIREVVSDLKMMVSGSQEKVNLDDALKEVEGILSDLKGVVFGNWSNIELRMAQDLLASVGEWLAKTLNHAMRKNVLVEHLRAVRSRLEGFPFLAIRENVSLANTINTNVRNKMSSLLEKTESVLAAWGSVKGPFEDAQIIMRDAEYLLWNRSIDNFKASQEARNQLLDLMQELINKVGILRQSRQNMKQLRNEAFAYVEALNTSAYRIVKVFESVQNRAKDPLQAVRVYREIADAIMEADIAVKEASEKAANATNKALSYNGNLVHEVAKRILNKSKEIQADAADLKTVINNLQNELPQLRGKQTMIQELLNQSSAGLADISNKLDKLPKGQNVSTQFVLTKSMEVIKKSQEASKTSLRVSHLVNTEVQPKMEAIRNDSSVDDVSQANAYLTETKKELNHQFNLTDSLSTKVAALDLLQKEVGLNMKLLRQHIAHARQIANDMQLPMSISGGCGRTYPVPEQTALTTDLVLNFKVNTVAEDMMLFFLQQSPGGATGDFLAVEMVQGQVSFSWNLGRDTASVRHPLQIEQSNGANTKWYKVKVTRTGNSANLTVSKLFGETMGDMESVTGASNPEHQVLNINDNGDLYIGGVPASLELSPGLTGRGFSGCIGEVYLNNKRIGLFNFDSILRGGGNCDGCEPVPGARIHPKVYQFDGSGYARYPLNDLAFGSTSQINIKLSFRTSWENALLLYANNPENGDTISLDMRQGQLVFQIQFGRGLMYNITAPRLDNLNQWTKVEIFWASGQGTGVLVVGRHRYRNDLTGSMGRMIHLLKQKLYVAGVPETAQTHKFGITTRGFSGCIQGAVINKHVLDLSQTFYMGMTYGCNLTGKIGHQVVNSIKTDLVQQTGVSNLLPLPNSVMNKSLTEFTKSILQQAKTVGFEGDGYLELPPVQLEDSNSLSFKFRTNQTNALLVLGMGDLESYFYSVAIVNGNVETRVNGGSGPVIVRSENKYNDGKAHTVTVHKEGAIVTVYVDDVGISVAEMPGGTGNINIDPDADGGGKLYIGGLSPGVQPGNRIGTTTGLIGCVSELFINKRRVYFGKPNVFQNADIGLCGLDTMNSNGPVPSAPPDGAKMTEMTTTEVVTTQETTTTLPTTTAVTTTREPPEECAIYDDPEEIADTAAFGGGINSHVQVDIRRKQYKRKFNISLEVRTHFDEGLLFYLTNAEQTEFIALQLRNGKVEVFSGEDGKNRTLSSNFTINDGNFHTVMLMKDHKIVKVKVDDKAEEEGPIGAKPAIGAPLYVAGLPAMYTPREGLVSEGFKGCIRMMSLLGVPVDITKYKVLQAVEPCYKNVENGAYFKGGTKHALYSDRYTIARNFSVEFDFRTSEPDGVLLSTYSVNTDTAFAIEIANHKIRFTIRNPFKKDTVESRECLYCLCDNQWHHVKASLTPNNMTLVINRHTRSTTQLERFYFNGHVGPLFIGGLPAYARMPEDLGLSTTTSFNGCMKDVQLKGIPVNWHKSKSLTDVHLAGCPV